MDTSFLTNFRSLFEAPVKDNPKAKNALRPVLSPDEAAGISPSSVPKPAPADLETIKDLLNSPAFANKIKETEPSKEGEAEAKPPILKAKIPYENPREIVPLIRKIHAADELEDKLDIHGIPIKTDIPKVNVGSTEDMRMPLKAPESKPKDTPATDTKATNFSFTRSELPKPNLAKLGIELHDVPKQEKETQEPGLTSAIGLLHGFLKDPVAKDSKHGEDLADHINSGGVTDENILRASIFHKKLQERVKTAKALKDSKGKVVLSRAGVISNHLTKELGSIFGVHSKLDDALPMIGLLFKAHGNTSLLHKHADTIKAAMAAKEARKKADTNYDTVHLNPEGNAERAAIKDAASLEAGFNTLHRHIESTHVDPENPSNTGYKKQGLIGEIKTRKHALQAAHLFTSRPEGKEWEGAEEHLANRLVKHYKSRGVNIEESFKDLANRLNTYILQEARKAKQRPDAQKIKPPVGVPPKLKNKETLLKALNSPSGSTAFETGNPNAITGGGNIPLVGKISGKVSASFGDMAPTSRPRTLIHELPKYQGLPDHEIEKKRAEEHHTEFMTGGGEELTKNMFDLSDDNQITMKPIFPDVTKGKHQPLEFEAPTATSIQVGKSGKKELTGTQISGTQTVAAPASTFAGFYAVSDLLRKANPVVAAQQKANPGHIDGKPTLGASANPVAEPLSKQKKAFLSIYKSGLRGFLRSRHVKDIHDAVHSKDYTGSGHLTPEDYESFEKAGLAEKIKMQTAHLPEDKQVERTLNALIGHAASRRTSAQIGGTHAGVRAIMGSQPKVNKGDVRSNPGVSGLAILLGGHYAAAGHILGISKPTLDKKGGIIRGSVTETGAPERETLLRPGAYLEAAEGLHRHEANKYGAAFREAHPDTNLFPESTVTAAVNHAWYNPNVDVKKVSSEGQELSVKNKDLSEPVPTTTETVPLTAEQQAKGQVYASKVHKPADLMALHGGVAHRIIKKQVDLAAERLGDAAFKIYQREFPEVKGAQGGMDELTKLVYAKKHRQSFEQRVRKDGKLVTRLKDPNNAEAHQEAKEREDRHRSHFLYQRAQAAGGADLRTAIPAWLEQNKKEQATAAEKLSAAQKEGNEEKIAVFMHHGERLGEEEATLRGHFEKLSNPPKQDNPNKKKRK